MQKRYARLADRLGPDATAGDDPAAGPAGTAAFTSTGGSKTFQLSRRWEYRRVDRSGPGQLLTEDELNRMGADGWELAGVVSDYSGTHYYLKRGRGAATSG